MTTISLIEDNIKKVLGDFVSLVAGIPCVVGQANRVAPPIAPNYAVMWPIMQNRLSTNSTVYSDCVMVGSIAANVLTVTELTRGTIKLGFQLFGADVLPNTVIVSGQNGVYEVNQAQTVSSQRLFTGRRAEQTNKIVTFQVDFHGPESETFASQCEGLFRSDWGFEQIEGSGYDIAPLHCSNPRQMPFWTGEQQTENRWSVDFTFHSRPIITVPQEFFDTLDGIELIEVDTNYPA